MSAGAVVAHDSYQPNVTLTGAQGSSNELGVYMPDAPIPYVVAMTPGADPWTADLPVPSADFPPLRGIDRHCRFVSITPRATVHHR
jgi:hypothetical protein